MVKGVVRLQKKIAKDIKKRLQILTESEVYVGIPQEASSRPGDGINNAELLYIQSHGVRSKGMRDEMQGNIDLGMKYSAAHSLYIQSHGSALWHIPPRPVLEPAIAENKNAIGKKLRDASTEALRGNSFGAEANLHKAGMLGENAAKGWFENPKNKWPPNAPSTIRMKGSDSPLIDSGEMRKKITYVIDKKGTHNV